MFRNIGKKIKTLSQIYCWAGIIVFAIAGIVLLFIEDMALVGLLFLLVGPLLSWIGAWLMYSWGDLVDNVEIIKFRTCGLNSDGSLPSNKKTVATQFPTKTATLEEKRLKQLLSKNLITQEEYDKAVRKS